MKAALGRQVLTFANVVQAIKGGGGGGYQPIYLGSFDFELAVE